MDGVHVSMIAGLTWNHDLCRWMKWSLGLEVAKTSTHGRQLTVRSFSKLEKVRTHHSLQVSWLDINWLRSLDLLWILAECSIRVLCGFRSIGQPMALHGSCGHVYSTPWPSRQAKKRSDYAAMPSAFCGWRALWSKKSVSYIPFKRQGAHLISKQKVFAILTWYHYRNVAFRQDSSAKTCWRQFQF